MPAHAGMWRAAEDTANNLIRRFAVVPMALETRGSDETLGIIAFLNLQKVESVDALSLI